MGSRFCVGAIGAMLLTMLPGAPGAWAQTVAGDAAQQARRFDATAYLAWFGANRGDVGGETYRDWFSSTLGGASIGHYWTEHLKTEVEFAATSEDRLTSSEHQDLGGRVTRYVYRDHYYRYRTVSVLQSWQFLHNAWVHPFVGVGVDLNRESRRIEGRSQIIGGSPGPPGFTTETLPTIRETDLVAHPVVFTGFKAYFARHGFFRTDVRAGIGSGLDELTWRFGAGFDF